MNDIIDLYNSGAIAFSGGTSIIKNSELILKSLLYLDQIDGLYISKPNDFHLSKGQVNDGINSNKVGLKGIPSISETIGIKRDLSILEYVGGKIHFSGISTKKIQDEYNTGGDLGETASNILKLKMRYARLTGIIPPVGPTSFWPIYPGGDQHA